jgi:hypothetical protein
MAVLRMRTTLVRQSGVWNMGNEINFWQRLEIDVIVIPDVSVSLNV